jgi:hypothetical protein
MPGDFQWKPPIDGRDSRMHGEPCGCDQWASDARRKVGSTTIIVLLTSRSWSWMTVQATRPVPRSQLAAATSSNESHHSPGIGYPRICNHSIGRGSSMTARPILLAGMLALAACSQVPPRTERVPDLSGNWVLTTISPLGSEDADMTVEQTGRRLAGKLSSSQATVDYTGTVEGDVVQFSFTFQSSGQPIRIDYAGVVNGDAISGKVVFGSLSEGTFTARRKSP